MCLDADQSGELDLVPSSVWLPEIGNQSVELNGGTRAATIAQAFGATEGATYRVSFYLAGNPAWQGGTLMKLQVSWEDIDTHGNTLSITTKNFTFDTTGKTPTDMGWTKHSFRVTSVPGMSETVTSAFALPSRMLNVAALGVSNWLCGARGPVSVQY